jgi:hypothetical protein
VLLDTINDAGSQAQGNNKRKFVRVQEGNIICNISRFKQKIKGICPCSGGKCRL